MTKRTRFFIPIAIIIFFTLACATSTPTAAPPTIITVVVPATEAPLPTPTETMVASLPTASRRSAACTAWRCCCPARPPISARRPGRIRP